MTLEDAVKDFESEFASVRFKPEHSQVPITWSGGVTGLTDPPPVLYSDPEHAISSWRGWASSPDFGPSRPTKKVLVWVQSPELIEYQITIADRIGRHRMVNNRWAVRSQF